MRNAAEILQREKGSFFKIYTEMPPHAYGQYVKGENRINADAHRKILAEAPFDPASTCLVIVGSDGKLERHSQSRTDIVIITKDKDVNIRDISSQLVMWYDDAYGNGKFAEHFDSNLDELPEVKVVGGEHPVSYAFPYSEKYSARGHLVYPDRILESVIVFGSEEVWRQARQQALEELAQEGNPGASIRKEMRRQISKDYIRALQTGRYRNTPVFDIESALQYYDENKSTYTVGFKIPALRLVQRKLDVLSFEAITAGLLTTEEGSASLPVHTEDRIKFMVGCGFLPKHALEAAGSYMWFLQQYHFIQELYKMTREPVSLPFDRESFEHHRSVIEAFAALELI